MRLVFTFAAGLIFLTTVLTSCRSTNSELANVPRDNGPSEFPDCRQGTCRSEITSLQQFDGLAGMAQTGQTTQRIVKAVYRRNPETRNGTVYFINTQQFQFHYDFVRGGLGLNIPLATFNRNYAGSGETRGFNQISLVHHVAEDDSQRSMILFEMWSGDTIEASYLIELFKAVKAKFRTNLPLVYHPLSLTQEELIEPLRDEGIESIKSAELFRNKKYIALNQGTAVGYLKFAANDEEQSECFDQSNIVVYDQVPNEIGLYSGVITAAFQTPLSHVNVKSINRGTTNMVLRDAKTVLAEYENKPIRLIVEGSEYRIEPLDSNAADGLITEFWNSKRPRRQMVPEFSNSEGQGFLEFSRMFSGVNGNRSLRQRHKDLTNRFGAKGTNLGLVYRMLGSLQGNSHRDSAILDVESPDGYGVPFSFYDSFMNQRQTGLDESNPGRVASPQEIIDEILEGTNLLNAEVFHSICRAKPHLEKIREVILSAKVPDDLVDRFKAIVMDQQGSPVHISKVPRIRLRSSTNSEDLPGFNGAGLYNSAGVHLYKRDDNDRYLPDQPKTWEKILDGKKGLIKAIQTVYSSVWNDRAFEEREWFRMNGQNHLRIKVAIAVHRAFPRHDLRSAGESSNGVSTSTNIYAEDEVDKVYFNAQHYDLAVTNPPEAKDLEEVGEDPSKPYLTEEILVTPFVADPVENSRPDAWKGWSYEILSRSSIKNGAPVLQDDGRTRNDKSKMETRRLAYIIDHLDRTIAPVYGLNPRDFAIDVEWKTFGDDRKIWIKQARPFDKGGNSNARDSLVGFVDDTAGRVQQPGGSVRLVPRGPRIK